MIFYNLRNQLIIRGMFRCGLLTVFFLATILKSNGQRKSFIETYTDSIKRYPGNPKFYYLRGLDYQFNEKYDSAIIDFSKAISLNPKDGEAYESRASIYNNIKEFELSIKDYTNAIAIMPGNLSLYNSRGKSYASLKNYELAIAHYSKVIKLGLDEFYYDDNDEVRRAHYYRGTVYEELKKYDIAIKDYTKGISYAEEFDYTAIDGTNFLGRGDCYYAIRKYDLAIQDYKEALEIFPDNKELKKIIELTLAEKEKANKIKSGINSYKIDSDHNYATSTVTKGDIVTITATGKITLGILAGSGGPEGIDGYTSYSRVAGFRHGSLLVRIGENGSWEAVGTSKKIIANRSGTLQFMVNDNDPSNNSGYFNVDVTVQKR